ncbi:hypothetical protein SK128_004741 [Halocaridina rubra]|uniref:WD repeat-containing protein 18 n=1 Tax=Halocaridina rubra TaxID=373956 RepID=A0AAN8WNP8_HALRR
MMEPLLDGIAVSSLNSGAECIQIYDTGTGTHLKSYRGTPCAYSTFCTVGNGEYILTAQRDKPLLQAWIMNRYEALQLRLLVPGRVNTMTVNACGPKYCVVGISEKLYLYKLVSGRLIGVASRHYQPVTCVKFTPCGNYFASGGEDGFVYLWSMASFIDALHKHDSLKIQPHFVLGQHSDKVTGVAVTSSGIKGFLMSASLDRTARVYDLVTGRSLYNIVTDHDVMCIACNTLGSQVFLGHDNGTVSVASLLPHPPAGDIEAFRQTTICHEGSVRCIAVTASGNQVITGGEDGEVKVWSITNVAQGISGMTIKEPHFALQRVVHTGRGPITNLAALRLDREVLTSELETQEVIAPFGQDFTSPLLVPFSVPIRGTGHLSPEDSDLLCTVSNQRSYSTMSQDDEGESVADLQSVIYRLKAVNSELYKFAVKSIIGDK